MRRETVWAWRQARAYTASTRPIKDTLLSSRLLRPSFSLQVLSGAPSSFSSTLVSTRLLRPFFSLVLVYHCFNLSHPSFLLSTSEASRITHYFKRYAQTREQTRL